ncbi:hypothetical protein RFM99_10540 [Mesorhizobium sp. VK4C]|uniref:hypothetical protein n=1 Tax=Mesorhizobium captivum TaxID=3072319 RepID=UPI002A24B3B2|nr:hypothetical protein [Mesorhizobium sp. VK4C]MDX8498861.1 hypothetical protein [Mesorhizobium sp. VK4C]
MVVDAAVDVERLSGDEGRQSEAKNSTGPTTSSGAPSRLSAAGLASLCIGGGQGVAICLER